jgi:hypothetical protein
MTTNIGKFPRNPTDGDEVSDVYGNRWKYTAENDAWISKGVVTAPATVTENTDGIIDSDIYSKLSKLDTYLKTGVDIRPLKLYPGTNAYWYYFRSSDKLFRFTPEGGSNLRIEVDKGRLFQILMKQICPGPRGPNGPKGDKGRDGVPGAPEVCYFPSEVVQERLDFAIYTPTPILPGGPIEIPNNHTPEISVRLFTVSEETVTETVDQMQHLAIVLNEHHPEELPSFQNTRDLLLKRSMGEKYAENLCDIPMSSVAVITDGAVVAASPSVTVEVNPDDPSDITVTSGLDIDEARTIESIVFDPETNIVCGSVYLNEGVNWSDISADWCVKSRQKGPDGLKGDPGECYVRIVECTIDDTNITVSCPIINARLDCDLDIIYTLCADLLAEICVDKISLLSGSGALSDQTTLKSVFASAQMTLEECKYVNRYEVGLESDETPELDLVHWDPQPGCVTQRHYSKHEYNWIPTTDVEACTDGAVWYSPNDVRPGKFPWEIIMAPEPEEDECCEDSWFWCPNVQDPPLNCNSPTEAAALRSQDIHRSDQKPAGIGTGILKMGNKKWDMRI